MLYINLKKKTKPVLLWTLSSALEKLYSIFSSSDRSPARIFLMLDLYEIRTTVTITAANTRSGRTGMTERPYPVSIYEAFIIIKVNAGTIKIVSSTGGPMILSASL